MKISVLATSSAGNSTFVSAGTTRLLIDAGLTMSETASRLKSIGEEIDGIDAVLLTHPHLDHAGGLATLIRHWRRAGRHVPVHCSMSTFSDLEKVIPPYWFRHVMQFDTFQVGDLHCETFSVQHDTGEPLGFTVADRTGTRATFALDLGEIDGYLGEYLSNADFLLLESNHDPDMLAAGPYAYRLKQRIAQTHLSNSAACAWITGHMTSRTHNLYLGHLSLTTNDPHIVRLMADQAIAACSFDQPPVVTVLLPGEGPSPPLIVGEGEAAPAA
jgi:phosphoribosyl 1,2-cyclic phosphodiesterase